MKLYGKNPLNAVKNILMRKEERLRGIANSKKRIKTALVVQGGAMRGVFSAGSLIALEKLGFSQGFDTVYGSSGGAMNAAYFLANQGPFGASIYYENINNSKFINFLRVKKIVDIDYLFDEVVARIKTLNTVKIINSKTQFYFFATEINTGNTIRFNSRSNDIPMLLKASCALPIYYSKVIYVNGKGYIDGGVCNAIPVEEAIKDGCTDILVLLTHSVKFRKSIGFFEKFLVKKALYKFSPKLFDVYLEGFENYKNAFDISVGKRKIKERVNIVTIVPNDDFRLNRLTKSENLLKNAAINGARKIFDLFNQNFDMSNILKYN